MPKIGELWVTTRLGRTLEERRELEEQRRRQEVERQAEALATALRGFGYSIEPVEYPTAVLGEWVDDA